MELTTNIQDCLPFGLRLQLRPNKPGAPSAPICGVYPPLAGYQALVEDPEWFCGAVKNYSCTLATLYLPAKSGSRDR